MPSYMLSSIDRSMYADDPLSAESLGQDLQADSINFNNTSALYSTRLKDFNFGQGDTILRMNKNRDYNTTQVSTHDLHQVISPTDSMRQSSINQNNIFANVKSP